MSGASCGDDTFELRYLEVSLVEGTLEFELRFVELLAVRCDGRAFLFKRGVRGDTSREDTDDPAEV